ncbi:hypothetical protein GCM10010399_50540 [Dactylosporangium fulvum]|uniref:FkbM family methyltransferase n=1 Tax=Dactylosporangium fulvum TaxID=53359 RepID=A0ABY5W7T2_9ACTN|nr:FkbM family methyltransferase [Dactylosporangium fulvum]UWP86088.1 FkbM family methyltransferase [Dactylosporangium fulvum]
MTTSTPPAEVGLPDGRTVATANPWEVEVLWREVSGDGMYTRAAAALPADAVIVDVGAHIGLSALCFADRLPDARIYAVEAAPATFECLRRNLERYVPGATAIHAAVGDRDGTATFEYYPNSTSMSTMYADEDDDRRNVTAVMTHGGVPAREQQGFLTSLRAGSSRVTVPVVRLSTLLRRAGIDRVDLLKVDVERAEWDVLCGIDAGHWPLIGAVVAEVHDIDGQLDRVVRLLRERGYTVEVGQDPSFAGGSVHLLHATAARDGRAAR